MSLTGHVHNGVVVLDEPGALPEGTPVEVTVRAAAEPGQRPSLWDRLADVVGRAEGLPADAASRVDHYLTRGESGE
jgi:hypothetical protein